MAEFLVPSFPRKRESRVLNGIARFARDLKSYLRVADLRQVTFLCSRKEKSPKESAPRSARKPLSFLAPPGARKLAGRTQRASGSISARLNTPGGAAVLGARYGDLKTNIAFSISMAVGWLLLTLFFFLTASSTAYAEVMDKEPSLLLNWTWAILSSVVCFLAVRFRPWILLAVIPIPALYFFGLVMETMIRMLGPQYFKTQAQCTHTVRTQRHFCSFQVLT